MKSTPGRTGASTVVHREPRRISQKSGRVKNADAEVAVSPHFSLTPHGLYSLPHPATAVPYSFYWRTWFPRGLQK